MTDIAIGARFVVAEPYEVRTPKGRLLARYLPEFDYRVTSRNLEIVAGLITAGKASLGTTTQAQKVAAAEGRKGLKVVAEAATGRIRGAIDTGGRRERQTITPADVGRLDPDTLNIKED